MPNVHTKKGVLLDLPYKFNGFAFEFIARSKYDNLILVRCEDESFFLSLVEKDEKFLIKADKLTRPTNVKILQDAMKAFVEKNSLAITFSTINSKKNHLKRRSKFLKDIKDFIGFKSKSDFEIEIGFGSGRHLLHKAKENSQKIFLGIEIHKPSIEQVLKQCQLQNIENIMILDYDARIALEVLESNSVDKIYVHFPVPWDKKPHRRVISRDFLEVTLRILKRGGKLELRTDSENYFRYAYELFLSLNRCDFSVKKNINIEVSSKYEDRWKKMKKNIYEINLTNLENSSKKEICEIEDFDIEVDFKRIYKNFTNKTIKKDGYFVHFENIYKIDNNSGILKLSFGAYDRAEHKYLLIEGGRASYLPNRVLPIWQNRESNKVVATYLKGFLDE